MDIKTVKKVLDLLDMDYVNNTIVGSKIQYLEVETTYNDYSGDYDTTFIYYNSENGVVIPNYEQKLKIKEKIKALKQELEELEKECEG